MKVVEILERELKEDEFRSNKSHNTSKRTWINLPFPVPSHLSYLSADNKDKTNKITTASEQFKEGKKHKSTEKYKPRSFSFKIR